MGARIYKRHGARITSSSPRFFARFRRQRASPRWGSRRSPNSAGSPRPRFLPWAGLPPATPACAPKRAQPGLQQSVISTACRTVPFGLLFFFERLCPFVGLFGGFVLRDAVTFLDAADQLIFPACGFLEIAIGQLAPLLTRLPGDLFPVAFNSVPVHCVNLRGLSAQFMPKENVRGH